MQPSNSAGMTPSVRKRAPFPSPEELRALVESMPDMLYRYSFAPPCFEYVSPASLNLLGYSPGEFYADPELWHKVAHPDDRHILLSMIERPELFENLTPFRWIRKDGQVIWNEQHNTLIRDEAGRVVAVQGIARDVTGRKRAEEQLAQARAEAEVERTAEKLEESKRMLDALMEYVPEGITIADAPDGRIRMVSRSGQEILGRSTAGLTIQDVTAQWKVYHKDGVTPMTNADLPLTRALVKGETLRNEEIAQVNARGEQLVLSCDAAPILDRSGAIVGAIVTWRDVTDLKRAEEAIQSAARFPGENPNPVMRIGQDGVLLFANEASYPLLRGWQLEIGKPAPMALQQATSEALSGRAGITFDLEHDQRVISFYVAPIVKAGYANLYGRDITVRKRGEEELRKLNRTLRALTNANQALLHATNELDYLHAVCQVIVEDCGHAMAWVGYAENDEAKSIRPMASAGFEEGYLETLKLTWVDSERGRGPTGMAIRTGQVSVCRNMLTDPRFAPWREQALRRGYMSSIVFPMLREGRAFGALTIYSREPDPFSEPEVNLLTELTSDLTYGVNVLRLRAAHAQAEAERDELLQREQAARAEAEAAVRIRDRFITLASHELKTPLTSLMGYAELLMRRVPASGLNEQDARMVRTIFRQTSRLEKMISSLLDISRIERGQLDLEPAPVDLVALIASTLKDIEPSLRRHTFEFIHPDDRVVVNGDGARLEQVLENLVQNGIKYSPSGGHISVRLTRTEGAARIAVRDEGIGIPAAAMPRLFTRFYRAENADANHIGGLGVGLSISRDIVRMHGGDITVTSQEGIGSEFTISLPLM